MHAVGRNTSVCVNARNPPGIVPLFPSTAVLYYAKAASEGRVACTSAAAHLQAEEDAGALGMLAYHCHRLLNSVQDCMGMPTCVHMLSRLPTKSSRFVLVFPALQEGTHWAHLCLISLTRSPAGTAPSWKQHSQARMASASGRSTLRAGSATQPSLRSTWRCRTSTTGNARRPQGTTSASW